MDEDERMNEEGYAEAFAEWTAYHESQEALPEHKREGYAERMYEAADMKRKETRESK